MSRPLPVNDDYSLHQLLRLGEDDPLPQDVLDLYWRFKFIKDRFMCCDTHCDVLALICAMAGERAPPPTADDPLHLKIRSGELEMEAEIDIRWRGGHPRTGKFVGYSAQRDEVQVVFIDEATERWFAMDKVMGQPQAVEA